MPKINQEEYEILKELDDRWKWIVFESPRIEIYEEKPYRNEAGKWWWREYSDVTILYVDLFKFITTADEDPYNIAELIEEYEKDYKGSWEHAIEFSGEVFGESEETEVKNVSDVIEKVERNINVEGRPGNEKALMRLIINDLEKLDEPEVLSQEFPVIPKFVADYLPLVKQDIELEKAAYYAVTNNELAKWKKRI